jgi:beta-glucosidase-like glycosyl hydrolase
VSSVDIGQAPATHPDSHYFSIEIDDGPAAAQPSETLFEGTNHCLRDRFASFSRDIPRKPLCEGISCSLSAKSIQSIVVHDTLMRARHAGLLLALSISAYAAAPASAQGFVSDGLSAEGKLGIGLEQARALESKLGQLFIVNVDGFESSGPIALGPEFAPLVERLQVGGVIPHYGSTDFERIRRTNRFLARTTRLPLLLCCDIVKLKGASKTASFGDGYVGGFIGKFRPLRDAELQTLASLNAFLFAAIGINVALGPTVDGSTLERWTADRARLVVACMRRFGIQPVLKHFPFLPAKANLHHESPDTRVPREGVEERIGIFRELRDESGIIMTTHLLDSLVDPGLVTFSPAWLDMLRARVGFGGLLMTDGLLMLKNYSDRRALAGALTATGGARLDETACWAARAILAGHDFVIVEGSAAQTYRAFRGVLAAACETTRTGKELRSRIGESYERIVRWKKGNERFLRRTIEVPAIAIAAVVSLVPDEGADLKAFRFDVAALARLAPEMERATAR